MTVDTPAPPHGAVPDAACAIEALQRDPMDAAADAERLAEGAGRRAEAILFSAKPSPCGGPS